MTYSEKLKDPRWQKKRLEIFQRDEFKCTLCGDSKSTLHIHHLEYGENPWDVDNEQLTTHCEHCHTLVETVKVSLGASIKVFSVFKKSFKEDVKLFCIIGSPQKSIKAFIVTINRDRLITDMIVLDKEDIQMLSEMFNSVEESEAYKNLRSNINEDFLPF